MWFINTIICIQHLVLSPFCSIGGKLPISFENFKTCDIAVDRIVQDIDEELKQRQITVIMKCLKDEQVNT